MTDAGLGNRVSRHTLHSSLFQPGSEMETERNTVCFQVLGSATICEKKKQRELCEI